MIAIQTVTVILGVVTSLIFSAYVAYPKEVVQIYKGTSWKNDWLVPETSTLKYVTYVPAVIGLVVAAGIGNLEGIWISLPISLMAIVPIIVFTVIFLHVVSQYNWDKWVPAFTAIAMAIFSLIWAWIVVGHEITIRLTSLYALGPFVFWLLSVSFAEEDSKYSKYLTATIARYAPIGIIIFCGYLGYMFLYW